MSRMKTLPTILAELHKTFGPLTIIETGTIRNMAPEYHAGDGWSTVYISEFVRAHGGDFTSVDLDISTAKKMLGSLDLAGYCKLVQYDSLMWLRDKAPQGIHFALLDSANDANHTFREFELVRPKMVAGGIIVIDDVIPGSREVVKGQRVYSLVQRKGLKHKLDGRLLFIYV